MSIRRHRYRFPDGRLLVQIAPGVFHVQDAFGRVVETVIAESVTIDDTTVEEPCEPENDPQERDQVR